MEEINTLENKRIENLLNNLVCERMFYDVNEREKYFCGYEISICKSEGSVFLAIYLGTNEEDREKINLPIKLIEILPEILGEKLSINWGEKSDISDIGGGWRKKYIDISGGYLCDEDKYDEWIEMARKLGREECAKYIKIW